MKIPTKNYSFYFIVSFLVTAFYMPIFGIHEQQFSVDRLYPENWYIKAREHCLLVWSTLDEIIQWKKNSVIPVYIMDASIGQLVFAHHCIHMLIVHNNILAYEDAIYLSRVVSTIEERCTKLPHIIDTDKVPVLRRVVAKLKKKIEILLSMTVKN